MQESEDASGEATEDEVAVDISKEKQLNDVQGIL